MSDIQPVSERVCSGCRWWRHLDPDIGDMPDDGLCMFVDMTQRFWTEGKDSLTARLHTAADFGCQAWEANNE